VAKLVSVGVDINLSSFFTVQISNPWARLAAKLVSVGVDINLSRFFYGANIQPVGTLSGKAC
jgi:hypothetical protein